MSFYAALNAAKAHELAKPPTTAPVDGQVRWLYDHARLLVALAGADDIDPDTAGRARRLAERNTAEARLLTEVA